MPLPVQRFLQDEHIILFSRMSFIKKMFFGTLRDFSICNNLNFLLKKTAERSADRLKQDQKNTDPGRDPRFIRWYERDRPFCTG